MFDVLVYLYENYWRPDACPDHDQLHRKLMQLEIEREALKKETDPEAAKFKDYFDFSEPAAKLP